MGFREVIVCSKSHSKKAAIWDTLNCFYLASETKLAILLKTLSTEKLNFPLPRALEKEASLGPAPSCPSWPLTQHQQFVVEPIFAHLIGSLARVPARILCLDQGQLQDSASCRDTGPGPELGDESPESKARELFLLWMVQVTIIPCLIWEVSKNRSTRIIDQGRIKPMGN